MTKPACNCVTISESVVTTPTNFIQSKSKGSKVSLVDERRGNRSSAQTEDAHATPRSPELLANLTSCSGRIIGENISELKEKNLDSPLPAKEQTNLAKDRVPSIRSRFPRLRELLTKAPRKTEGHRHVVQLPQCPVSGVCLYLDATNCLVDAGSLSHLNEEKSTK
jgi:hypothetical protein